MIWKPCILYAETADYENTDELGNPTKGTEQVWSGKIRFTPWTDQQIALEGRDVTKNEQQYAVPVAFNMIEFARKAEIDGVMLKVIDVTDMSPRWSVIRVKVYGS